MYGKLINSESNLSSEKVGGDVAERPFDPLFSGLLGDPLCHFSIVVCSPFSWLYVCFIMTIWSCESTCVCIGLKCVDFGLLP